jgi:chorismate synthase
VVQTKNDSGGTQGGISVGEPIEGRIAFKPTATITAAQETVDNQGREAILSARGRHDPCVVRVPPVALGAASSP